MSRLLLITPQFHGYWQSIERAFIQLGYDVVVFCYDAAPKGEKVYNKLRYELPSRLEGKPRHLSDELITARACQVLDRVRPDQLLVVRGDSLTSDFWVQAQRQVASRAVWLYDELRRMYHDFSAVIDSGVAVATYSPQDAAALQRQGVRAALVPLAFDPELALPAPTPVAEVSFVGAAYPARINALRELQAAGIPVRAFGRGWSNHPIDRVRTWRLHGQGVPNGRDLPRSAAYAVMRDSVATLNLHGDQDGFTMRTFEAAGVGAIELVDRAEVATLYEPGREVLVFDSADELLELCRRALSDRAAMVKLRVQARARTLAEHTFVHRARQIAAWWR